jgi:hypothetical protein
MIIGSLLVVGWVIFTASVYLPDYLRHHFLSTTNGDVFDDRLVNTIFLVPIIIGGLMFSIGLASSIRRNLNKVVFILFSTLVISAIDWYAYLYLAIAIHGLTY